MKTWLAKLGLTALTAAALLLPSASTYASGSKIYVDDDRQQCPTAQFFKIQDAVDAAQPGDTVYICSGSYQEQLVINKKLTLRSNVFNGQALPLISNGVANTNTILVKDTKDVTIRDLRLAGIQSANGIMVNQSPNVTVEHTELSTFSIGIFVGAGDKVNIHNNSIRDASFDGILVSNSIQAKVADNTITGGQNGVEMISARGSSQISGNVITSPFASGITLRYSNKVTVSKNTVKNSQLFGIRASESSDNTFKDNTLQNSASFDAEDVTQGDKTAGTQNTWTNNTCKTSESPGLCKK